MCLGVEGGEVSMRGERLFVVRWSERGVCTMWFSDGLVGCEVR